MKKIYWLIIAIMILVGCMTAPPPTPISTATITFTPVPLTPTVPPTPTRIPINVSVKTAIGETEFNEISVSIGVNDEIKAIDYSKGEQFDGIVTKDTITSKSTADWYFKNIVTADAKNADGETFPVVWNPASNQWIRITAVDTTDLSNKDTYTHFNNIDLMVSSGDFDLVLLAQGDFAQPFPADTESPEYWIKLNRGLSGDLFFNLDSSRIVENDPYRKPGEENYQTIMRNRFNFGKEAYRLSAFISGTTSTKREIYILADIIQNGDKTNIINPLGMDPKMYDFLTAAPGWFNEGGENYLKTWLNTHEFKFVPIIPSSYAEDWDKNGKAIASSDPTHTRKPNRGGMHQLEFGAFNFDDDAVMAMQTPGTLFSLLPADMKATLEANLTLLKTTNPTSDKWRSVAFTNGINPEFAMALSRTIFETGFSYGSSNP